MLSAAKRDETILYASSKISMERAPSATTRTTSEDLDRIPSLELRDFTECGTLHVSSPASPPRSSAGSQSKPLENVWKWLRFDHRPFNGDRNGEDSHDRPIMETAVETEVEECDDLVLVQNVAEKVQQRSESESEVFVGPESHLGELQSSFLSDIVNPDGDVDDRCEIKVRGNFTWDESKERIAELWRHLEGLLALPRIWGGKRRSEAGDVDREDDLREAAEARTSKALDPGVHVPAYAETNAPWITERRMRAKEACVIAAAADAASDAAKKSTIAVANESEEKQRRYWRECEEAGVRRTVASLRAQWEQRNDAPRFP